ncbi:hypothetical protein IE4771_PB00258 (plasmid) [Rhizobium etli bv. mimosae str. IE4771]|uniref:Uncharacterized protein n=1 Tax=Rhizobium etli bv. mimosae str. IE4771 TaxID=1432050 RepID=A0A060I7Z3_RHIET|nr:hypothetical protein IE4771_PB00258 [Rhizobium sp. IE4771]
MTVPPAFSSKRDVAVLSMHRHSLITCQTRNHTRSNHRNVGIESFTVGLLEGAAVACVRPPLAAVVDGLRRELEWLDVARDKRRHGIRPISLLQATRTTSSGLVAVTLVA